MKKVYKNVAIAATCVVLAGGGVAYTQYEKPVTQTAVEEALVKDEDVLNEALDNTGSSKDETVYVIADANGSANKIIVSNYLNNKNQEDKVKDTVDLNDIKDVKGSSTYDAATKTWTTGGNDVYYQGTSNKQLPVTMDITYKLNGKEIAASELAGKSGKLEMTFNFTNNEKTTVNGETVYVPFVCLSGMVLNNSNFKNIKISNGKLMDDGDKTVVMGYAIPGLEESLGIHKADINIPSKFTVTTDVKDFEMALTLSVVTNQMFNELDTSKLDKVSDIKEKLNTLADSSEKLVNGSSDLYAGLDKLLTTVDGKTADVNKLAAGAQALVDGAAKLEAGATKLDDGLSELTSNSDGLRNGTDEVVEKMLATVTKQVKESVPSCPDLTKKNWKTTLTGIRTNLYTDVKAVASATCQQYNFAVDPTNTTYGVPQIDTISKGIVLKQTIAKLSESNASELALKNALTAQLQNANAAEGIANAYDTLKNANSSVDESLNKIKPIVLATATAGKAKVDATTGLNLNTNETAIDELSSAVATETVKDLDTAIKSLESLMKYQDGVNEYTAGVDEAAKGSKELKKGIIDLSAAAKLISDGASKLKSAWATLVDGAKQLDEGSAKLNAGMTEFNEKGVEKIMDIYENDIHSLGNKLKALQTASKGYRTYCGSTTTDNVKFIYRTEAINK